MAEFTSLATRFWEDPWIQTLSPTDKLLYICLFTNAHNEATTGIYEVSLRTLAHLTGLESENIQHSLNRFAEAGKVHYVDGWVILMNHFKNNPLKGNGPLVTGALRRVAALPWQVRERLTDRKDPMYLPYLDSEHDLYIGPIGPLGPPSTRPVPVPVPVPSLTHTLTRPKGGAKAPIGDNSVDKSQVHGTQVSDYAKRMARRKGM